MKQPLVARVGSSLSGDVCSIDADDDWDDLEARIEATPASAMIRGMFLNAVMRLVGAKAAEHRRYIPFRLYPAPEYMRLLLSAARSRFPRRSAADALLALGLGVYSVWASSLAGTAVLAVAGRDFRRICELAAKSYEITLSPGHAQAVRVGEKEAIVQLRDVWIFPDIFHAGIWLGALRTTGLSGTVEVTRHSLSSVDFHVRWD
jgi:uncharacterized protein (TIGR02265 family)